MGMAMMGYCHASGRTVRGEAAERLSAARLLEDVEPDGCRGILVNIKPLLRTCPWVSSLKWVLPSERVRRPTPLPCG